MRTAISPAPDPFPAQPKAHTSGVIKIIFVGRTNLLAFVDGEADLFLAARNLVEQSKFAERLGVQGDVRRAQGVQYQHLPAPGSPQSTMRCGS